MIVNLFQDSFSGVFSGLYIFLFFLLIAGCSSPSGQVAIGKDASCDAAKNLLSYAQYLTISVSGKCYLASIFSDHSENAEPFCILLCPQEVQPAENQFPVIQYPVLNFALTTTTQAGLLDFAGGITSVKAVQNISYFFNPEIQQAYHSNQIKDIQAGENLNWELLLSLQPGLLLHSTFNSSQIIDRASRLQIQTLPMSEHLEHHPLGRVEWSLLLAILTGKYEETKEQFDRIAANYNALRNSVESNKKPAVLINMGFRGVWYVPGNDNYLVQLIRDAGGRYLWQDKPGTASIALDLEQVLSRANQSDVWINTGRICNRTEILAADPRYAGIKAFLDENVFGATARISNDGQAFDFYESAVARPDLVLQDLISIFHPEDGKPLYYYESCQ